MDEINERHVLRVLKDVSDSPDCCQFFIITPKLLHNIDFPERCKVITIHSLPHDTASFPHNLNDTDQSCKEFLQLCEDESDEDDENV